jgi:hypothetical protein
LNIEQDHTLVKIVTTMTLQPLLFINRVTRRVSLEKQEVPTLPEHLHSPLVFNGVFVARSLVFFGVLCRSLFVDIVFIKKSLKIQNNIKQWRSTVLHKEITNNCQRVGGTIVYSSIRRLLVSMLYLNFLTRWFWS